MKTVAALCVTLAILYNIAFAVGDDLIAGELRRTARQAGGPGAIDCKMSRWSDWTECDPCLKNQFRSRTVEVFGQFKGQACKQPLADRRSCQTSAPCIEEVEPPCSDTQFQCESGICIKKRLECNGDNDCGDHSDEDCDEVRRPTCGKLDLELSYMGQKAGNGINILGVEPIANAFNNKIFNGVCNHVRDPNTGEKERVPWNVATLQYDTRAEESFSTEIFEGTSSVVKEILEENTFSLSLGLSFKYSPTELKLGPNGTESVSITPEYNRKETIEEITKSSTNTEKSYIRIKGYVQLSSFRMRSRDPTMSETFLTDVKHLPLEYTKGEYFRFLEEYGTHYAVSGKEGGEYELIYVLNKEHITSERMTSQDIENCFKLNVGGINLKDVVGADGNLNSCKHQKSKEYGTGGGKALIDKVVTSVRGGKPGAVALLKASIQKTGIMDVAAYVEWAKSINVVPVIINNKPEVIQSLIPLKFPNANVKKENLRKAFEEYIAEYSVCKCQPCQNGGTVTLIDGECQCLCLPQFEGLACEKLKDEDLKHVKDTVVQDGNWGCWSSWSTCSEGVQSRIRSCNTKGLVGGTCKGETSGTEYC